LKLGFTTGKPKFNDGTMDSGLRMSRIQNFRCRIWSNSNEIKKNGIDTDNNAYVDDINGWDFALINPGTDDHTDTELISTGRYRNGYGIMVGCAIDWSCKILPFKSS
jgi:hypothetical protein